MQVNRPTVNKTALYEHAYAQLEDHNATSSKDDDAGTGTNDDWLLMLTSNKGLVPALRGCEEEEVRTMARYQGSTEYMPAALSR